MAKDKGKEIEVKPEETFGIKIPPEPPPQVEPKPPTAEEQMATLRQQMDELKSKYEQTDKGLRSAQATLTQKDRLLKAQENVRDEIETLKNMVKILATRPISEEEDIETVAKKPSPDIDKAFAALEEKQKVQEYQRKLQEQATSYQQRVEALGLSENDESYWEIYKMVMSATPADFKLADIRLKKLEKEKEIPPVDTKKPADEKDKQIETMQKEIERLKKIASGELDTETGLPSGASANEAQIRKAFREHPDDAKARKDYLEWSRNKKK